MRTRSAWVPLLAVALPILMAQPAAAQLTATGSTYSDAHSTPAASSGSFSANPEGSTGVIGSTGSCGDDAAGYASMSASAGALGLSQRASSAGSPSCGSSADGHGNLVYHDGFTVTSATLPNGTPVTLTFCVRAARTDLVSFVCGGGINDVAGVQASVNASMGWGTSNVSANGSYNEGYDCFDGHSLSASGLLDTTTTTGPLTLAGVPVGALVTVSGGVSASVNTVSSTQASGLGSIQVLLVFGVSSTSDVQLASNSTGLPMSGPSACSDQNVAAHMPYDPRVLSVGEPSDPALEPALSPLAPNPSPGPTTVRFSLPRAEAIDLSLYSVAGQRVARVASGYFGAGGHAVRWDGRGTDGASLRSGLYECRLRVNGLVRNRKLMIVRR